MENRFGVKDLFQFILLAALIIVVVLGMKQYDRQWTVIQEMRELIKDQTTDLANIRAQINRRPIATTGPAANPNETAADARIARIHEAKDYAPGDRAIDTSPAPPDKLTPLINGDLLSEQIQSYVLDTLADRDPNTFEWLPRLAYKWETSPDGKSFDFWLRHNAVFSNGDPVTADDVIFTMQWTMNEAVECPRLRAYLDRFDHVEKIDEFHVRYVFKDLYFKSFETAALTQVMSKKFYSKFSPKEFNESSGLLIGSGPYRLPNPGNWTPAPGQPIELVRNERYWGEPPGLNRLVWSIIPEESSRLIEFRNGGTDVVWRPTPQQFDVMVNDPDLKQRANMLDMDSVNAGYTYIGWNEKLDGKPTRFADKRVRRALTMLIDRQRIVDDIYRGRGSLCTGSFNHNSPQYDPSVKALPYDPKAAIALLAEAGYKKQGNQLIGPDGAPFEFELYYNSTNTARKQVASFVKDSLAEAGIVAEPKPIEWAVLLDRLKQRKFESVIMGWGGVIEEDPTQIFHSSSIAGVGDNFVQYSNPKLDAVIDKAKTIVNDAERMPVWHEVHRIIAEDQPYTFLVADHELAGVNKRFKGVEATKTGLNSKTEWYVPATQRKFKD
jgi:peptide/nickel transport system substrate-binding protein